jgi:DNA invertase Pin-like site-specific DNA recombinase
MNVDRVLPVKAAVYVRKSTGDERAASIRNQEEDGRAFAERLGFEPEVFVEAGRSASEYANGDRPVWEALGRRLGEFRCVIAWRQDRFSRDELDWHRFVRACGVAGVRIVTVADGIDIDPHDPDLLTPSVRAAVAAQESRNTSMRVRRGLAKVAADGMPQGGLRRYGYERREKNLVVLPEEKAVVLEAAGRVLGGESVRSIVRDLNARGIPTATGKRWSTGNLGGILTRPTVNGRRSEASEPKWEPILDDETWAAVRRRLAPTPRGPVARPGRRLLRGFARCGRCGARLVGASRTSTGVPDYICHRPEDGGCGRLRITAVPLEEFVRDVVVVHAAVPAVRKALANGSDRREIEKLSRRLEELERVADDLAAEFGTGGRDRRAYRVAAEANAAERAIVERTLGALVSRSSPILADAPRTEVALRRWWDAVDDDRRRALIDAVVERIDIGRGRRGPNALQVDRVSIVWRA